MFPLWFRTLFWLDFDATVVPSRGSAGYLPNLYRRAERDSIPLAVYAKCLDLHPLFIFLFFLKHLIKSGVRDWNVATPRDMRRLGEPVLARVTCGGARSGACAVVQMPGFVFMQPKHEGKISEIMYTMERWTCVLLNN